jgi:23S rRNA U2552 (ribose-2'-O)-methylase RlmE/FtsJ
MNDIKEKITSREKEWDFYKKYTNPYEYIHSIVPQKKKSVSKYKPISRSYFKMLEMIAEFKLDKPALPHMKHENTFSGIGSNVQTYGVNLRTTDITAACMDIDAFGHQRIRPDSNIPFALLCDEKRRQEMYNPDSIRTFHLAEGPGGFIEAICNKRNNPTDEYYGMTIIVDETDDNVPAWHKTGYFLSQHPNVNLEYGADGTGNLLHIDNFEHCVRKYGSSMDLVTADGGFDFSKDFNHQEISITNLLWGQVCYALCLQKKGGNFVLKIFDIFYEHTVHILYILAGFYEEVNVCKLKTSRVGNSEKYVVCRRFRFDSYLPYYPVILESFSEIKHTTQSIYEPREQNTDIFMQDSHVVFPAGENCGFTTSYGLCKSLKFRKFDIFAKEIHFSRVNPMQSDSYIWRLLNTSIPRHFTKQVEDINAIFGQQQIENIHYTISLIDKQPKQDKLDQLVKQNIAKCANWCMEHSITYNNLTMTNLFEAIPLTRQTDIHCDHMGRNSLPALGAVGESRSGGAKRPITPWSATENTL